MNKRRRTPDPWSELFALLRENDFTGWTSFEGGGSPDAVRVMKYYRKVWESYARGS